MPLSEFNKKLLGKSIKQVVSFFGDGELKDGSACASEFREFLTDVDVDHLEKYANSCLEESFKDSGRVLQDIINEVGNRIGFDVTNGLYQGRTGQNNSDGIWKGEKWTFIVEVKTTDAYSIDLKKIAAYRQAYCESANEKNNSCLIVVGRNDTATLEDQLRGSKHNWEMRIIGVKALFNALRLKEASGDFELSTQIIDLLRPHEFTRVDKIISLAFNFTVDRENIIEEEMVTEKVMTSENVISQSQQQNAKATKVSNRKEMEYLRVEIRGRILKKFKEKFQSIIRINLSSLESNNPKGYRFFLAVSKSHEKPWYKYWYTYFRRNINYLNEADHAYFVFGCLDSEKSFAIPKSNLEEKMSTQAHYERQDIHITVESDVHYLHINKSKFDISEFEI